jgi:hypothetical protein
MRAANDDLRSLSAELGCGERIGFFCECRLASCFAVLWRTTAQYDAIVADAAGWLLADGHVPSIPFSERRAENGPAAGADELTSRRERRTLRARMLRQEAPGWPSGAA